MTNTVPDSAYLPIVVPERSRVLTRGADRQIEVDILEFAIVIYLERGRAKVKVYGEGIWPIEWRLFASQSVRQITLTTKEQHFKIIETYRRKLGDGPELPVAVEALVRCKLVNNRADIEHALQAGLDSGVYDNIANIGTLVYRYVWDGIQEVLRHSHLCLLRHRLTMGDRVKTWIDTKPKGRRLRENLAVEVKEVLFDKLMVPSTPPSTSHTSNLVVFDGPIDYAPGCRYELGAGVLPEPVLEVGRDLLAIYADTDGHYQVQHAGKLKLTSGSLSDPEHPVLLLRMGPHDLQMTVEASVRVSHGDGNLSSPFPVTADVSMSYRIDPQHSHIVTPQLAHSLEQHLKEDLAELCRKKMTRLPRTALDQNEALAGLLRDDLLAHQPFISSGVRVEGLWVTRINVANISIPVPDVISHHLVRRIRIQDLIEENAHTLRVPSNYVVLIRPSGQGTGRVLTTGKYHLAELGVDPYDDAKQISTEEHPFEVMVDIAPMLPLASVGGTSAEMRVKVKTLIRYWLKKELLRRDDAADILDELPVSEERLRYLITHLCTRTIAYACRDDGLAFLDKNLFVIEQRANNQLPDLSGSLSALTLDVSVPDIEHPCDAYLRHPLQMHRTPSTYATRR